MNAKIVLFAVFSFLLFLLVVAAFMNETPSQTVGNATAASEQTQQANDKYAAYVAEWHRINDAPKYTVLEVAAVFADNEVGGEQRFRDSAQVEGVIGSIETRAITGDADLELIGGVTCVFEPEHVSQLASLHRGQEITVVGQRASRFLGEVFFHDCQFVSLYAPPPAVFPKTSAAISDSSAMSEPLTPSDGIPFVPIRRSAVAPEAPIVNETAETQGDVLEHVGGRVSPPRQIYAPEPEFSKEARNAKLSGVCTLGFIVETDGRPSNIRVLKGLGMGLDEKAMEAVQNWKFEPAMKDGHPVRVEIAVEVDFHLY